MNPSPINALEGWLEAHPDFGCNECGSLHALDVLEIAQSLATAYQPFKDLVRIEPQPLGGVKMLKHDSPNGWYQPFADHFESPSADHEPVRIQGTWFWAPKGKE